MSTPSTSNVFISLLTHRWKEAAIGILAVLLATSMNMVIHDLSSARDKLKSIPDPSQIVTSQVVNQRFDAEDKKIENNAKEEASRLDRIDNSISREDTKLDSLLLMLANHSTRAGDMQSPRAQVKPERTQKDILVSKK